MKIRTLATKITIILLGFIICSFPIFAQETTSTDNNSEDYYLYPLNTSTSAPNNKNKLLYNLIIDQGYQVHCANSGAGIKATPDSTERLKEYIDTNSQNIAQFAASGNLVANTKSLRVPMMRNDTLIQKFNSSIEEFFGNKLNPDNLPDSGVLEANLTTEQKCEFKINKLRKIKFLCEQLQNPSQCTFKRLIPDTEYYLYSENPQDKNLLSKIDQFNNSTLSESETIDCSDYAKNWNDLDYITRRIIKEDVFKEIQDAFKNMTLDLEKAYKTAFLVIVINQTNTGAHRSVNDAGLHFWFSDQADYEMGQNQYQKAFYLPFKIPYFASNFSKEANSLSDTGDVKKLKHNRSRFFADTGYYSAGLSLSSPYLKSKTVDNFKKRDSFYEKSKQPEAIDNVDDIIYCYEQTQCDRSLPNDKEVQTTLIKMINANDVDCSKDEEVKNKEKERYDPHETLEDAGLISTSGNITTNDLRKMKNEDYTSLLIKNNYITSFSWQLTTSTTNLSAANAKIRIYLVAPIGENTDIIVQGLRSDFTSTASSDSTLQSAIDNSILIDAIPNSEGKQPTGISHYYPLKRSKISYQSSSTRQYTLMGPTPVRKQVGVNVNIYDKRDQNVISAYIPYAEVGWYIRQTQLLGHPQESSTHQALLSCKRTEDMFLGICPGMETVNDPTVNDPKLSDFDGSPMADECSFYRNQTVDVPSECDLISKLIEAEEKYGYPAKMIWGILKLETSSFMRAVKNNQKEINCTVNSSGAIGPFQIIQPVCTDKAFIKDSIKPRDVNPCDFDEALNWATNYLMINKRYVQRKYNYSEKESFLHAAGRYGNDPNCNCKGNCSDTYWAHCNNQDYCTCADQGLADSVYPQGSFEDIKARCGKN